MNYNRSAMLDLVRKTVSIVKDQDHEDGSFPEKMNFANEAVEDIEFVYDPETDKGYGKAQQEHGDEWRHVNKPPTVLRRMLATEEDPEERSAIELAMKRWGCPSEDVLDAVAAKPYKGESRVAKQVKSLSECLSDGHRASHVEVRGSIDYTGRQSMDDGSTGEGGRFLDLGLFDFEYLMREMQSDPLPVEGWY